MADLVPAHGGLAEPVCRTVEGEAAKELIARAERMPKVPVSDAQEVLDHLRGDLAIQPLRVGFAAYYESIGRVDLMENHPDENPVFISAKQVRAAQLAGGEVDPRVMRPSTSKILAEAMAGRP